MPQLNPNVNVFENNLEESTSEKRGKICGSNVGLNFEGMIPIPIQIFLWRQSDPFIKKNFGNLTEASALNFNRILVQNILHGLSPSLSDAIDQIPTWLFHHVAFPHIMQACSAVIEHNYPFIDTPRRKNHHSSVVFCTPSSSISAPVPNTINLHVPAPLHIVSPTPRISPFSSGRTSNQSAAAATRSSASSPYPLTSTEIYLFHTLHHLIILNDQKSSPINKNQYLSLNLVELFIFLFIPFVQTYFRKNEKDFFTNPDLVQGLDMIWRPLFQYVQPEASMFNQLIRPNRISTVPTKDIDCFTDDNRSSMDHSVTLMLSDLSKTKINEESTGNLLTVPSSRKTTIDSFQSSTPIKTNEKCSDVETKLCDSITGLSSCPRSMEDIDVQAPLAQMNSVCPISDFQQSSLTRKAPGRKTSHSLSSLPVSNSAPSITRFIDSIINIPTTIIDKSPTLSILTKARSSESFLLATYFDVGLLRTLFCPSWLTEGYLWCLEYLQQRLTKISDQISATARTQSTTPINFLRFKCLSLPGIHWIDYENNSRPLQNTYHNEQRTKKIIEDQYSAVAKTNLATLERVERPKSHSNLPLKYFADRSSDLLRNNQRSSSFNKQLRRINYMDDEDLEPLEPIDMNDRDRPVRSFTLKGHNFFLNYSKLFSSKKQTNQWNRRKVSENRTKKNLSEMRRLSFSDTDVNYKGLEETDELQGSSEYVNRNGTINFGVVLAGLHAVICKDDHLRICELVMNNIDILFGLAVVSSTDDDQEKKKWYQIEKNQSRKNEFVDEWYKYIDRKDDEKYQLAMDIILRILKRLGCSHCQPHIRTTTLDQLRNKVRLSLNRLQTLNPIRFERGFLKFIAQNELIYIFETFHALCSYCSISQIGIGHYSPYLIPNLDNEHRQTYANQFGATHMGHGPSGVTGIILNIVVKPLVTRLNSIERTLFQPKNINLYAEARAFFLYIKEQHGGILRSIIFSPLIDPQRKLKVQAELLKNKRFSNASSERKSSDLDSLAPTSRRSMTPSPTERRLRERPSLIYRSVSKFDDEHLSPFYEERYHCLYVDLDLIRTGLLRTNYLLQLCPPGSLPDVQFLNNILFLEAPVLAKAAYLLECALYIRRCSLGQWPDWMRANNNLLRSHSTVSTRIHADNNVKTHRLYQAAAARMFYMWGEALSSHLEMILDREDQTNSLRQFWNFDESSEDFYRQISKVRSNSEVPFALQLIICLVLYEITSFLRDTFETLPKLPSLSSLAVQSKPMKSNVLNPVPEISAPTNDTRGCFRTRINSVASQVSHRSGSSLVSEPTFPSSKLTSTIVASLNPFLKDRRSSFGIPREPDPNILPSTTIVINDDEEPVGNFEKKSSISFSTMRAGNVLTNVMRSKFVRRGSAKLRKASVRNKESGKGPNRPSFRARRRSHMYNMPSDMSSNPIVLNDSVLETTDESASSTNNDTLFDQANFENMINTRVFPWVRLMIRTLNRMDLTCNHQDRCLANCFEKQSNSCRNLIQALLNMYQTSSQLETNNRNETERSSLQSDRYYSELTSSAFDLHLGEVQSDQDIHPHFVTMISYVKKQVGSLIQIPLMILCKSSALLEEDHYSQVLYLCWKLLLDRNEELSACAATIIILTGVRASHLIDDLFNREMKDPSALVRYQAVMKFQVLWRFRSQFRMRLEVGASTSIKILPPSIEFVLPSPLLGLINLQTVDPPWMPHAKTLVQQVALNQKEMRTVITASKSRQKHQQELIHSALMTEQISKRVARENFALSTVPILQTASFESLLHQSKDDEDEAYNEDDRVIETNVQIRQAQGTLPSAFSTAVFQLIDLMEDEGIIETGALVSEAARTTIWTCLLDEPTLLIRFFFEKLSHKERRIKSLQRLRLLMLGLTEIPSQCAHAIFNYALGLLISMIRSPLDGTQELTAHALTLLWQIIPYVNGLVLKDLKQMLRTEQAEMMVLVTGNVPSAKRVIIHGPDVSQIPTQAIITEDTLFSNVLQEALEFFGISDAKRDQYNLIDIKTQQILIPETYVRDFYFFRRNVYPQLSLVSMETKQAQRELDRMGIYLKTTELSKVLFARHLLENTPFNQIHSSITFFHDELIKNPLFPRKALEYDFDLVKNIFDKELVHLDMLHKYNWIKLISCIFFNMDGKTSTTWDITLFLNVINGSFILHCEDLSMLRFCLGTYINIARHFLHVFATNGYSLIMPTILRVYSNLHSNPMLKQAIEYCCRQFFVLHRIPFILQMLGSIAQCLDCDEQSDVTDTNKIQPTALFDLLVALEQMGEDEGEDHYSVMEFIRTDTIPVESNSAVRQTTPMPTLKKIKSVDFCYDNDNIQFTLLHCFDVCVSVVAYGPDSTRSLQMLGIIDLLLPKYLIYIRTRRRHLDFHVQAREELKIIEKLSVAIKTTVHVLEPLTRTFIEPKHDPSSIPGHRHTRTSSNSVSIVADDDSMSRFIDDRTKSRAQDADERKQASEFRLPRHTLLSILSVFIDLTSSRVKELKKILNDPTSSRLELIDTRSYNCLTDIAHTLLKLSSFDPVTISCRGLQSYFRQFLPCPDWTQEQLRPALNLLFRRIDRMLTKICKKPLRKRCFDWEATSGIINGIYSILDRHPYIAHFPSFKALLSCCINLIIAEHVIDPNQSTMKLDSPTFPKEFPQAIIKLSGRYLTAIKNQAHLEAITNMSSSLVNHPLAINHMLHFLLPLMFRACSDRSDAPKFHSADISYIVTFLANSIKPASKLASTMGAQLGPSSQASVTGKQHLNIAEQVIQNNNMPQKSMKQLKDLSQTVSLLGLKILIVGFEKQLKREWARITQSIKLICHRQSNMSSHLLLFIDFLASYKTSIYIILRPFLLHYMRSVIAENEADYELITSIYQKLLFEKVSPLKSTGDVLNMLRHEFNQLKSKLTDHAKSSEYFENRLFSTDRVRFDPRTLEQSRDHDDGNSRSNTISDERSTISRTTSTSRVRQQQPIDCNGTVSKSKRINKLRLREALNIMDTYNERCKINAENSVSDKPNKLTRDSTLQSLSSIADNASIITTSDTLKMEESSNILQASTSRPRLNSMYHEPLFRPAIRQSLSCQDNLVESCEQTVEESSSKLRLVRGYKKRVLTTNRMRLPRGFSFPNRSSDSDVAENMDEILKYVSTSTRPVRYSNTFSVIDEHTTEISIRTSDTPTVSLSKNASSKRIWRQYASASALSKRKSIIETDDESEEV